MRWYRLKTFSSLSREARLWRAKWDRQKTGLALISVGLVCFGTIFSFKAYQEFQKNVLSFSMAPKPLVVVEEGDLPEKIIIPKVKIDLPVFPAKVVDDQWEISQEGVSYLLGTGIPGREGNIVIYGHNHNHLFGPIRWLEKDNQIKLVNKKGEEFIYQIVETKTVSPQEIEVLAPSEDVILTLYTCTGFLDRERFVVVAKLQIE